jgi:hypothetical protein
MIPEHLASLLITQGPDVVFVSRQLGHADPAITLRVYADEFAKRDHAARTRALLDAAVGTSLETNSGLGRYLRRRQAGAVLRTSSSLGLNWATMARFFLRL